MNETTKLETEKISKLIISYSIPAIIGMLITAIYNVVDRIFIGNSSDLGSLGIAAIAITAPIYNVIMGLSALFGNGGATLFSIFLGNKKEQDAKKILGNSVMLLIATGIVLAFIGTFFIEPILNFLGATGELLVYAKDYIQIILLGSIFQLFSLGLNYLIRSDGHPKTSMITISIGAIVNILLDPIFIYVFHLGMKGAAIATIIGQACSSIFAIHHFLSKRCSYSLEKQYLKFNRKLSLDIFLYGFSSFIFQISASLLNMILNKKLLHLGGEISISAMGIISSLATLIVLPVVGLAQGANTIISYNYGAKNKKRILETVKLCLTSSVIILVIFNGITYLFNKTIISIFTNDTALINYTSYILKIWFAAIPFVGLQIVTVGFLQSIGRFKTATILNLCRQFIVITPLILIFSNFWGINGVFVCSPTSDTLSTILSIFLLISGIKSVNKHCELDNEKK